MNTWHLNLLRKEKDNIISYYVILDLEKAKLLLLNISYDKKEKRLIENEFLTCREMHIDNFIEPTTIEDIVKYAELLLKYGEFGSNYCNPITLKKNIELIKKLIE